MSADYQAALEVLLRESGCTVRRWRTRNHGTAYTREADWGIEIPPARGPVAFAVGAHEIGHQFMHRGGGRGPRWVEELEAEEFAVAQFERFELAGVGQARANVARHLRHAAAKAVRRGARVGAILERYPAWVWGEDAHHADELLTLAERFLDARQKIWAPPDIPTKAGALPCR